MAIKFVDSFTAVLKNDAGHRITAPLWGDPVHVLDSFGGSMKVLARGREVVRDPIVGAVYLGESLATYP